MGDVSRGNWPGNCYGDRATIREASLESNSMLSAFFFDGSCVEIGSLYLLAQQN